MSETNNHDQAHADGNASHHDEHPKPKYDDVNMPVVVLLGVLSAILTFVSIAFVQGLYFSWQESMVLADWNSRSLTPQEKSVVEQKRIRDGFFETADGKIFVSVETAARKMTGPDRKLPGFKETPAADSPSANQPAQKTAEPQKTTEPAPGNDQPENDQPENDPAKKGDAPEGSSPGNSEPAKGPEPPGPESAVEGEKKDGPSKQAVTNEGSTTGEKKE